MVFGNLKRLKWIEEQLSCGTATLKSTAAPDVNAPLPSATPPAPTPPPALQTPQESAPAAQDRLRSAGSALQHSSPHAGSSAPQPNPSAAAAQTALAHPGAIAVTASAGAGPASPSAQSIDAEQLLRGLLLAPSELDAGERICRMAAGERQCLLGYLQQSLKRLPAAAVKPDSYGDAYAPPAPLPKSQETAVEAAWPVPQSVPINTAAAQVGAGVQHSAVQLKGHPGAVCAVCEGLLSAAGQPVWACSGQCCQFFHAACAAPAAGHRCSQCSSDRRVPSPLHMISRALHLPGGCPQCNAPSWHAFSMRMACERSVGMMQARLLPVQGLRGAGATGEVQHGPLRTLLPLGLCCSLPADQLGVLQHNLPLPSALLHALWPQRGLDGYAAVPAVPSGLPC